MSLVICSNQVADGQSERQKNSIYKAWSFRNQLSSTYQIPANAQVALQSCKVNVDGRIVLSRQNNVLYQYFGKRLSLLADGTPQIADTIYHPLRLQFLKADEVSTAVKEFSLSDFAIRFQERLGETIYHPNLKEKVSVDLLRNASGLDFLGYKIGFSQHVSGSNTNATLTNAEQNYADRFQYAKDPANPRNGSGLWTWTTAQKKLQRNASAHIASVASAIMPDAPLSLNGGNLEVNISGTHANVNKKGREVPWAIGLSRYMNNAHDGLYTPYYNEDLYDDDMKLGETPYMDFGCARNIADQLVVFFTAFDATHNKTRKFEVAYWDNTNGSFATTSGRLDLGDGAYEKVKLTASGEQMKLEIYNALVKSGSPIGWQLVCSFMDDTSGNKVKQFQPIHQACWCLHPVLQIGATATHQDSTMNIGHLKTPPLTNYDVKKKNQSGWWETLELLGRSGWCRNVEARPVLQPLNSAVVDQGGINASGFNVSLSNVLIVDKSDIYAPSFGANAKDILGFSSAVIDSPDTGFGSLPVEFHSNVAPSLESSQAMFVRLDGMNQRTLNALTGNRSQIIGHLPRFDSGQSTGRLYFEPKNFVWIDMDNPNAISVSDFNLSFCYSNEQFATILTGQSIVVLYFRKKPDALM
tara:strand:- start:1022 stop:2938 length:1917 start_codon:yes stop_codon:yes gene_type:complete